MNVAEMDRRTVLIGGTALATAAALPLRRAHAQPKKGGHMKIGIGGGGTSDSLDPATFDATFMITTGNSFRNNVTEIGPDNTLQGALVESWEPSNDAKTWIFKLRKGVEWHNGKPLEPEDIIASLNLHRGEQSKSGAKGVVAGIAGIKADGKDGVIFTLESSDADFPYILTDYHLNIVPAKDGKADWQSGIGTGAYTLEHFEPGVRAEVKLNPNRWQQEVGFVDSAEILLVNDPNARQNGVVTGELHGANRVDLKTVGLLKREPTVRILDVPGQLHHVFPMNMEVAPFDNNDVRLALKLAIDREEYLQKILKGYGTLGNDSPIGPPFRYHASDIPQRTYDPDKAKHHLKKAGMETVKVNLSSADFLFSGAVDAAVLYQSHAAKAGIEINVKREPGDGYFSQIWMVKPWYTSYWGTRATEDMILSIAYLSTASWNETRQKNEKLDKLIIGARGELDEQKRTEMYREVQLIIRDEGGVVVPAFANMVMAVGANVGTSENIGASWDLDGGHCVKRWWLT
jgi:peptide/nickel transport system substrate-binding protein